jgi:hypothetical protein
MLKPKSTYQCLKSFVKMQSAIVDDIQRAKLFIRLDKAFHQALFVNAKQSGL